MNFIVGEVRHHVSLTKTNKVSYVGGDVESFEDGSAEVAKKDPELTELETNGVGVGGAVGGKESTVGDGDVVRGAVGVPRSDGSESELQE